MLYAHCPRFLVGSWCLVAWLPGGTGLPPVPWPTSSTVGAIMKAEFWPKTKKTPRIEFNVCWYWDNMKLRLITTSAFAEVRFRHDGPCVSSLGLWTGKRNSSSGEHIHIFPRMLAFVSGAEKSHHVNKLHSGPNVTQQTAYQYQTMFCLPISLAKYKNILWRHPGTHLYTYRWVAPSCLWLHENENLHQKAM